MIHEPRVQEPPRTEYAHPGAAAAYQPTPIGTTRASQIGWGALIAGVVAAMASQTLLAVLGLAIGLSIPGGVGAAEAWTIGAGIWLILITVVSLFFGGWVAALFAMPRPEEQTVAYTAPGARERHGTMYGLLTWATVTALSVIFVAGMGTTLLGGMVGGVAEGFQPAERQAIQIGPAGRANPAGNPQEQQLDERDRVIVTPQQVLPREVLEDDVRPELAVAAWWTFFALLLGAAAAGFGGYTAATRDIGTRKTHRPGKT